MAHIARIIHHDSDICNAVWRDLFVTIFRQNTTVEGVEHCRQSLAEVKGGFANGCAMLTIVEPGAPLPSSEARDALSAFLRGSGDVTQASALVYEGAGFRAAAVRSVVTGISLVAKQPYPHKVFATVNAAASWLAPSLPDGPAASREMVQVISEIREELASLSPPGGSSSSAM